MQESAGDEDTSSIAVVVENDAKQPEGRKVGFTAGAPAPAPAPELPELEMGDSTDVNAVKRSIDQLSNRGTIRTITRARYVKDSLEKIEEMRRRSATESEESRQEAKEQRRNFRFAAFVGLILLAFLLASVASNAVLTFVFIQASKDTEFGADGRLLGKGSNVTVRTSSADFEVRDHVLTDDNGEVMQVGEAEAHLPLIALPVLPRSQLERLRATTVRVFNHLEMEYVDEMLVISGISRINSTYIVLDAQGAKRLVVKNGQASLEYVRTLTADEPEDPDSASGETEQAEPSMSTIPNYASRNVCAGDATCSSFSIPAAQAEGLVATAYEELARAGFGGLNETNFTTDVAAAEQRRSLSVTLTGPEGEAERRRLQFFGGGFLNPFASLRPVQPTWLNPIQRFQLSAFRSISRVIFFGYSSSDAMVTSATTFIPSPGTYSTTWCTCSSIAVSAKRFCWQPQITLPFSYMGFTFSNTPSTITLPRRCSGTYYSHKVCVQTVFPILPISPPGTSPAIFPSGQSYAFDALPAGDTIPNRWCWDDMCQCMRRDIWIDQLSPKYNTDVNTALLWLTGGLPEAERAEGARLQYLVDQNTCSPRCNKFQTSEGSAPLVLRSENIATQCNRQGSASIANSGLQCLDVWSGQTAHAMQCLAARNAAGTSGRRLSSSASYQGTSMGSAILIAMTRTVTVGGDPLYPRSFAERMVQKWCDCWMSNAGVSNQLFGRDPDRVHLDEWQCLKQGCASGCSSNSDIQQRCVNIRANPDVAAAQTQTGVDADLVTVFVEHQARRRRLSSGEAYLDSPLDEHGYRRELQAEECCHPARATVELASGSHRRMDALRVGDHIRTPTGFEPVVGFLHADPKESPWFYVFTTEGNASIAISDRHWLFVDGVEADPATVKVGQMLNTTHGPERIRAVVKEPLPGAYHLVTPSGAYYVDGVAASTYAAYIPLAAWKIFGDGYMTLRYRIGIPLVPQGDAPVNLFWFIDTLDAAGISKEVQSAFFWPFIVVSVVVTEFASAVGKAATHMLPAAVTAIVVAPIAIKVASRPK